MNENIKPSDIWNQKYLKKVYKVCGNNIEFSMVNNIHKKFPKFYYVKWYHFLPFFIGYFASLFQLSLLYGGIRSSSVFNEELYKFFKNKVNFLYFLYFLLGPILFIILIIFFPLYSGISWNDFAKGWGELFNANIENKYNSFKTLIIDPLFTTYRYLIGITIISGVSMINIQTILSYWIFNTNNNKRISLYMLDDVLKLKIYRFVKK